MSRDVWICWIGLGLAIVPSGAVARPAPPAPSIRWEVEASGRAVVIVEGIDPARLEGGKPAEVLAVRLDAENLAADRPAMLGSYRVENGALRFRPAFPLDRGRRYRATFRPSALPGGDPKAPEITSTCTVPRPDRPRTTVVRVDPSGDVLPENVLKFYLHFSAPMSRGESLRRVRVLKGDGEVVDRPFVEVPGELWDPTGTRLTMLVDPGRIKRGLKPREQYGPVFEAGQSYTLAIDPGWPDAEGDPLAAEFRKPFRAGVADEAQPDPKTWTIARPLAGSKGPLTLTFPEPLDRALVESGLALLGPDGRPLDGRAEVSPDQRRWTFTPEVPWVPGEYPLEINSEIEDLAGNSIRRPFEVDVQRDVPTRPEAATVRLPIRIAPAGR